MKGEDWMDRSETGDWLWSLLAIVFAVALIDHARAQPNFDQCGVLEQGVECLFFKTQSGERFSVDETDEFGAGDRARIRGVLDRDCASICQEGDGCLVVADIIYCDGAIEVCGELVQGVECVLLEDDRGFLFTVENQRDFEVGDRVRVSGTFREDCATTCQQTSGCIEDNFIRRLTPLDRCPPDNNDDDDDDGGGISCPLATGGLLGLGMLMLRKR